MTLHFYVLALGFHCSSYHTCNTESLKRSSAELFQNDPCLTALIDQGSQQPSSVLWSADQHVSEYLISLASWHPSDDNFESTLSGLHTSDKRASDCILYIPMDHVRTSVSN